MAPPGATRLPFRPPFAAGTLLPFLGSRAISGVEEVADGAYRRTVRIEDEPTIVTLSPTANHVELSVTDSDAGPALQRTARDAFDLDAEPTVIDAALSADPALAPLVAARPGLRVPGTFDGFELVIRAIYGQQVSVAGARTSLGRLATTFGPPLERPAGGVTHLFPSATQVAAIPLESFGMPRTRAATIRRVAELVDAGELRLDGTEPAERTLATLAEVRGIGPWTLAYVAMRALGDRDAFIAGDLGVRRAAAELSLPSSPKELIAHAERWRPWRAYAVIHLWHAGT